MQLDTWTATLKTDRLRFYVNGEKQLHNNLIIEIKSDKAIYNISSIKLFFSFNSQNQNSLL